MECETARRRRETGLLALTGQAGYRWNIATDHIEWSGNFAGLIGLAPGLAYESGREFEKLIQAEGSRSRFGEVLSAAQAAPAGGLVRYQCVYAIAAQHVASREAVWLEDTGVWEAGENGRPAMAEGVVRVISERRKREEELRRKSDFDDLTGIANRRFLEMKLGEVLKACNEHDEQAALIIIGLDRIDIINDFLGFSAGDELIRKAGERIAAKARGDDLVARFSGAKFGVILRQCSGPEMHTAARRFLDTLQGGMVETEAGPVTVSASVGACLLPRHAASVREAVSVASAACKTARRENGYRIHVHEPDAVARAAKAEEAAFAARVADACRTGAITLAFQPVVEAASGAIAFHECLVRMAGETDLARSGASIVSVAHKLGFIGAVDHVALELTLKTLAQHPRISLSLNVSNETAQDPFWLSKLASGLNAIPGAGGRLIVEITESHAAGDLAEAAKFVAIVHSLGCRVAVDDFGAGFTSFANLKALPVDIIKIDGSFAGGIAEDRANQVFVKSLLAIAGAFGARIVVEWIEDKATARLLAEWGVDYLQGHLFGTATTQPSWRVARTGPAGALRAAG
ncbi:MAG: GGDEF-domain containing protein [Alphaproteobacteria bacterium]|nr:MAG: GGDEF-domain containing protein [Alphaproteobacteria bacterium]